MNILKKIFTVVFVAATAFFMVGSAIANAAETKAQSVQATSDSPTETVKKFAAAMCSLNFTEAKKYCDSDAQKAVDSADAMLKAMPADTPKEVMDDMKKTLKDSFSFTVKGEKINGDKATVTIESKSNGKTETSTLTLKKSNGKWIITE